MRLNNHGLSIVLILVIAACFSLATLHSTHDEEIQPQHYNKTIHFNFQKRELNDSWSHEIQSPHVFIQKRSRFQYELNRVTRLVKDGKKVLCDFYHPKYKLYGDAIGKGINGFIFRAKSVSGMKVAVKFIPDVRSLSKKQLVAPDKELWEAKIMRKATKNDIPVVKYLGSGNVGHLYYIIMELVENSNGSADFSKYIQQQPSGSLALPVATKYLYSLSSIFAQLHALKIYHGDIKDLNMLINSHKRLIPCDFGASRFLSSPDDMIQLELGTIAYAPQNLIDGQKGNAIKHDVYSLGMTYFYMLYGFDNAIKKKLITYSVENYSALRKFILSFRWTQDFDFPFTQDHMTIFSGLLHDNEEKRWTMAKLKEFMEKSDSIHVT